MPESETDEIDYYPSGWTEYVHEDAYIEWVYGDDETIVVRLDGTTGDNEYTVTPITGVNDRGEEFVTRPISHLSRAEAFDIAETLIYAMNGTAGRVAGDPEFTS